MREVWLQESICNGLRPEPRDEEYEGLLRL